MAKYLAVVHKEPKRDFGVSFPDFSGCVAAGATLDEAKGMAHTVGLVYIEGDCECLNEELVCAGFAWVYDRYCRIRGCNAWNELESQARKSKIGLWHQACPTSPWEWRHSK